MTSFIHLHVHSEYSLADSIIPIKSLIEKVKTLNMPAVAITDVCNIFGAVKFFQAALNAGVKPILGVDLYIKDREGVSGLTLFCQNKTGYLNLCQLMSRAYLEGQATHKVILDAAWLENETEGLIALFPMASNPVTNTLNKKEFAAAQKKLQVWKSLFPDRLYLELTRTEKAQEALLLQNTLQLAERERLPVVASNNVRFLTPDDYEAHEARVCIQRGEILNDPKRKRLYTEKQFLKSPEEMEKLFDDLPEALENSIEIAKRCNLELTFGETFLPDFPTPNNTPIDQYLEMASAKGLEERLETISQLHQKSIEELRPEYDARLTRELGVINSMGFAGYFCIVADFIQWAKNNDIPVGPGRGSGAGSLVAYALKITDLDPLQYELLFERFLNPERVSMPDFDIDFCMEGRDRVIDYVAEKYGRDSVSQIITFGTMAAKAVVRDVGRVLNHPYGFVDKIAKLIPFEIGMTLDKALTEPALKEFYEENEDGRTIIDLAKKLEGLARNAGKHAGGVVIAPGKLSNFTAIYCESGSQQIVSQFDKDDIETIGLVKFDFLGLRTLTIIDWAIKSINVDLDTPIDINNIPLGDEATFSLLQECNTTAVFQLESRGMKELIKRLEPDHFEEIVALVALFRPGPLQSGMVDDFIDRKHGRAKVVYAHPDLEPILQPTYGVILYQEQVMQIAQVLAGYTLGAADILRRAMGKKKPEEMAKQRKIFVDGAEKNNIKTSIAEHIFDLMEKFAGYGFNKSHSAAYALISYQTAWLKTHYPAKFMAAVLSSDMDNTDKVVNFLENCKEMKLNVLPPDINRSDYAFKATSDTEILFGLGAIKGAGESALEIIIEERKKKGEYKHFYDLCHRVASSKVNKRVLEALIKSGSLDTLGPYRASLLTSLPRFTQAADQHERNLAANQNDLFGGSQEDEHHLAPDFIETTRWQQKMRLRFEKDTLGFYLSGHPFQLVSEEAAHFISTGLKKIAGQQGKITTVAGVIHSMRSLKTKRGDRMAAFTLDDGEAKLDGIAFSDIFEKKRDLFKVDQLVIVVGEVSLDDFTENYRIAVNDIYSFDEARERFARFLQINLAKEKCTPALFKQLQHLMKKFPGKSSVCIHYENEAAETRLPLGDEWKVKLCDDLLESFKHELDVTTVCVY